MSSILVSVLHELIGCVTSFGAASLCHSSRALHGGGLYLARRSRKRKHHISKLLEGLLYSKLPDKIAERVGSSQLERTQACACSWIDSCDGLLADDRCLAFALLRLCVKFELREDLRKIVLKHIGAGTEPCIFHSLEWSLLRRLRIRSEPMSIDGVIQPLAWDPHLSHDDYTMLPSGALR